MINDQEISLTLKTIREASLFGHISLSFINLLSFDYFEIHDGYVAGFYIPKMWNKKNSYKGIITHKCIKIDMLEEIHMAIVKSTGGKNEIPYVDQYHPVADVIHAQRRVEDHIKPYWFIWHFDITIDNTRLSHGGKDPIEKSNIEYICNLIEPGSIGKFRYFSDSGFMKVLFAGLPANNTDWENSGLSTFKKKFRLSRDWKESFPSKRKEFMKKSAIRNMFNESILIETLKI